VATTTTPTAAPNAATTTTPAPVVDFGKAIANFAVKAVKEQKVIGNGECWTLANDAIAAAGAWPPMWRSTFQEGALNFGTLIGVVDRNNKDAITKAQPGDILQFYNACLMVEGQSIQIAKHTGIVAKVTGGTRVMTIEANVAYVKTPQAQWRDFNGLLSGKVKVWRAVAKGPGYPGPQ
jgi:hypothetical protein